MKITRLIIAAALVAAAAACSADVTTPERRAPVGYSASEADTTSTPKAAEASGALGSGGGK